MAPERGITLEGAGSRSDPWAPGKPLGQRPRSSTGLGPVGHWLCHRTGGLALAGQAWRARASDVRVGFLRQVLSLWLAAGWWDWAQSREWGTSGPRAV